MNDAVIAAHAIYRGAVAAARAAEEAKSRATAALAEAVEAAKAPASPIIIEFERRAVVVSPEALTLDWSQWRVATLDWSKWRLSMDDVAEFLNVEVAEVEKWDEDRWRDAASELDCVNDGDAAYLTESLTSPVPLSVRENDTPVFFARAVYAPIPDDEA